MLEKLARRDRWLIMAYDQVDRISPDHDIMYSYIRTLIMYWFSVSTRWSRLKCKIFIRTDLRNSESLQFPDASKLGSRQIDLSWNTLSLYHQKVYRLSDRTLYRRITEKRRQLFLGAEPSAGC